MNSIRLGVALMTVGFVGMPALRATDWTTTDGKTYEDVKLIRLDPDSVTILYEDGGARIPLEKLSPDLQKRFGYDPEVAKAAAEARAKAAADNARALQAEMNQASDLRQAGPEPAETATTAPDSSTPATGTAASGTLVPAPVFDTSTHHTIDEATQAAAAMRRDLSDPNYHTMAHMFYTVKSLGPDPADTHHHTMDDAVNSAMGK